MSKEEVSYTIESPAQYLHITVEQFQLIHVLTPATYPYMLRVVISYVN